jgi:hypothetical protein
MAARHKHRQVSVMQARCDRFNAAHPVGAVIRVWPGTREGEPVEVQVRTPGACILSGHTDVVYVTSGHGCISLDHVEWEDKPPRHDHLKFVREQGCVVASSARGPKCLGIVAAHHVRTAANAGTGMKPPDTASVGLCWRHHSLLHSMGRKTFEATYGVGLAEEAERLASLGRAVGASEAELANAGLSDAHLAGAV